MKKLTGSVLEIALVLVFVVCVTFALCTTFLKQQNNLAKRNLTVTTRTVK